MYCKSQADIELWTITVHIMCMPHTVPSKQDHLCFKHWLLAWRHWEINWSSIGVSSGEEINQSKNFTYHSVRQWASSMTTAQHRFDNSVIRHTRIALGSTALSGVLRNTWPNNTSENNIENYQWRLKCDDIRCGMAILNCLICQKTVVSNNVQLFQICTLQWRRTSCKDINYFSFLSFMIFADWWQTKHDSSALLALCEGNVPLISGFPHKGPIIEKAFLCDDVIMGNTCSSFG